MAIKVNGTTVIDDSRNLSNVGGLKTVGGNSLLGSGDISTGSTVGEFSVGGLWQNRVSPSLTSYIYDVITDGSIYIICNRADDIATSTDGGETWTSRNTNIGQYYRNMYSLAYDGTTFVIMGESSRNANSTNGTSWTDRSSIDWGDMYGVCAGQTGYFAACGNSGNLIRSTNSGNSWASISTPTTNFLRDIEGDNSGYMVAVGDYGTIIQSSNNGASWTLRLNTNSSSQSFLGVGTDGSGNWVAVGQGGLSMYYSTNNGVNWTQGNPQTPAYLYAVKHDGTNWVAVGSGATIATATNPSDAWTVLPVSDGQGSFNGLTAVSPTTWMAVGNSGKIMTP